MPKKYDEQKLNQDIDNLIKKVREKGKVGIAHFIYGRTLIYLLLLILQLVIFYLTILRYRQLSSYYYAVNFVTSVVVIIAIINEEINPMYKMALIIPIMAVPIVGIPLYIFLRFQPRVYRMKKKLSSLYESTDGYYVQDENVLKDLELSDKGAANTAKYLRNIGKFPLYNNAGNVYYPLGDDVFRDILIELEKAEKFIFIEYFIIHEGIMWDAILEVLKKKAAEGVEVRVMYDGTCQVMLLPYSYPKQLEKFGIKAKAFSPLSPVLSMHQNNRDHRKILVVDGRIAFTGGVNLSDEYINEVKMYGHWKDTAISVTGDAVNSFTAMFLEMWNVSENTIEDGIADYISCNDYQKQKGYVIPYADSPLDKNRVGEQVYFDILNQSERYVYIMTPYLILDNEMVITLCNTAKRGVDVRIIMPHIPDKYYAFALAGTYYPELIDAGVKIYEYEPGFVHAKVFLSDDEKATVGTINMDFRSFYLHFECGTYLYKTDSIESIKKDFEDTFSKCILITKEEYKKRGLWMRMVGRVLRLFAPLM